jgi:predicted ATPase
LTLTGPGGIGKTRLALRAAAELGDDFEDGSFFVPLAPIHSAEHLVQAVAEALKFPLATHEDPQHQLLRYLRTRQVLLVMDNFEHLLDGVGIVSDTLQGAPEVKILATSRERLNLHSETVLIIGGMLFSIPAESGAIGKNDALALFVQSARKIRPDLDPAPEELEQIRNICHIVQGMPLAIELAAAWVNLLNMDEIAAELEHGLDILATEMRDAPERHRSIHAVFNHSWSMLTQTERETFMQLSVFRGGFTREAAQQVAGASLQGLAGLVNKSFLSRDPESGRLEVHELLRQYAQERLGERPQDSTAAREAHAAYFARFMDQRWDDLKGSRQLLALAEIEADIENVRTAWRYYTEHRNAPQLWMFVYALWQVYWIRGWNHAGMELFAQTASALQGREVDQEYAAIRAVAMAFQAYFMSWLGLSDQGFQLAQASVEILEQLDHPEALVFAYDSVLINAYMLDRIVDEVKAADEMLRITAEMDDKWLLAFTYFASSMIALVAEDFTEARRLSESNLKLYEQIGDVIGSSLPLITLGHVALARGELEGARESYLRCLTIAEQTGFYYGEQTSTKYLGKVTLSMGDLIEADYYLHRCLSMTKDVGFVRDIINLLYEFARLRVAEGYPEQAVELLGTVIQHPASHLTRMHEGRIRDSARDLLAGLEAELPPEIYAAALERGQALDLDEVVADLVDPNNRR